MKLHLVFLAVAVLVVAAAGAGWLLLRPAARPGPPAAGIADSDRAPDSALLGLEAGTDPAAAAGPFVDGVRYRPHALPLDPSGFRAVLFAVDPWKPDASLQDIARRWQHAGYRGVKIVDRQLADASLDRNGQFSALFLKANLLSYEGEAEKAYQVLCELRTLVESDLELARSALGTVIYLQGVMGLRQGENDNCLACQGDSACLLPIARSAVHTNPTGSRLAIRHFTEYLNEFPDNLEVRWLLNLAHMTLGEYPDKVDPRFLLDLSRFFHSESSIGAFREISIPAGLGGRMNESGGAIMDDFDNDGLLDVFITCHDPTETMAFYRNRGDGKFADRTKEAGLADQLGGLVCYQADYDNDGLLDVFIPRGAWHNWPMRPSLLRNRGGQFEDVTKAAGLLDPVNSNAAGWADYDNDGHVDLFIACERQSNRLYRNKGDGTFEEVGARAGVQGDPERFAKGCSWLDYDNDGFPDLFVNNFADDARLYHNERDGRFFEVTTSKGIDGPRGAFSCWTFDYDNDGWLDIFAVAYDRPVDQVVKGMLGMPVDEPGNRLYRNLQGRKFQDVTTEVGLETFFASMGSNFADFDNDGFLDFYLATGALNYGFLVPNRMLRNLGGKRFADISSSSRTGHLQKGHGVACGDWDRDGDVDLFVEMGGGVSGDKYHNLLFQNPGQGNHWLGVKLIGKKTNRAAIGARIKAVTAGPHPMAVHRVVTSGSSFGGNALEQTLGLARADRVATLEVHWPASGTTQVLHDVPADQLIAITELAEGYRRLERQPVPEPR